MCGILGALNYDGDFDSSLDLIKHRGPDAGSTFQHNNIFLGHRRLKIIDLSDSANQPMTSNDGRYTIIFNGEIYNFQSIRNDLKKLNFNFKTQSDTEVILYAYIAWKEKCLDKFNGMFAFAIYDNKKENIFIARDRVGIKPLYYFKKDNQFIFSSEINPILNLVNSNDISTDYSSIIDYFTYLFVPEDKTLYKEIKKLLPGHYLNFNDSSISIKKYWDVSPGFGEESNVDNISDKLEELIEDSVKMRLVSDVPVGSFLSGGIDSSLITYYAEKNHNNINTFYADFDGSTDNDIFISNLLKTNHHREKPNFDSVDNLELMLHYGDLFYDTSSVPYYHIAKIARKNVTVCLSGDGGDELFYGYNWYNSYSKSINFKSLSSLYKIFDPQYKIFSKNYSKGFKIKNLLIQDDIERYVYLRGGYIFPYLNQILSESVLENIDKDYDPYWLYRKHWNVDDTKSSLQYIDFKNFLVHDVLFKCDMMSMLHGLEVRVPFLDHRIVEYVFQINPRLINQQGNKYLLKRIAEKKFGKKFINQQKKGFGMKNVIFNSKNNYSKYSKNIDIYKTQDLKLKNMITLLEKLSK
jgi:asparagine synthase (glutamine-hydrolysing)